MILVPVPEFRNKYKDYSLGPMVLLHHTFGHNVAIATSHNCDCDGILARLQIPAEFRSESPLHTWFWLFGTGMLRLSFCCSTSFWMTHFHTSADLNTPPPNCKSGLIRSVRAYLSFLSLHTTKRSWYGGSLSWVELPSSWRKMKPRPLCRNFGSCPGFQPNSNP
jgi:hypothetical protein